MIKLFATGLFVICLIGCNPTKNTDFETADTASNQNPLPQLKHTIDAHGSLELWKSFGSLYFERPKDNFNIKHTIDLRNRNEVFTDDSTYTVGYFGAKSWVLPDSAAFTNLRFYKNLYFYFFALPFVAADNGVLQEYLGQKTFNDQLYDMVKISFGENIGDSPDDNYILYLNAESKQLSMINYSVTYFDNSKANNYSAIVYEEWQNANGLLVPKSFSGYKWENDTLGDLRYQVKFENVLFDRERPNQNIFEIPANAYSK